MQQFIFILLISFQSVGWAQVQDIHVTATFSATTCESIQLTLDTLEINQSLLDRFQKRFDKLPENSPHKEKYRARIEKQTEIVTENKEMLATYSNWEAVRVGFRVSEDIVIPGALLESDLGRWQFNTGIENNEGDILLETDWSHSLTIYGAEACNYIDETGSVENSAEKALKKLMEKL